MSIATPTYRIIMGTITLGAAIYLSIFTDNDYGAMLTLAGTLISAGLVKELNFKNK